MAHVQGTAHTLDTPTSTLQLDIWTSTAAPNRAAIFLHPWAKLGGSMEDPTVLYNFIAAKDSQLFNTVVRYNMRGAHNSVAKRNFNLFNVLTSPDPDSQDLVAVCDYVLEKLPNPPQELYLIGYSYGATVAASALQQVPQVVGYVAIGFPLGGVANLVLRSRALWSELELSPIPKLVLQGTRDSYSPLSTLRDLVLQYNEFEPKPGPLELQTIDGADHFFQGRWQEVADKVMAWIQLQVDTHSRTSATA